MLFQPAIIALLLASALCVLALAASAPFALEVIRRWDIRSGSERQLQLERRTYLFSTLLTFVLALQLASVMLFVFNAEKMSGMFVGAMCAVGTLNVNAFGFPALNAKIAVFFLAAMWLAINHVDSRARDYPLVRIKYALLLALAPLLIASGWVELQYFLGLKADVITSCCGSLFSEGSPTLAAEASALPPVPAMWLFYGSLGAAIAAGAWHGYGGGRSRVAAYALAATSALAFAATIAGILSFVSLYIYEHPNHHCPFCILKPEYGYQGYWLYVPLFGATAAGLAAGAIQPFARIASLRGIVPGFSRNLAAIAAYGFALTAVIATAMIWQSRLILLEH
ncbi:MAG: hypothetical protein FD157_2621 [Rhodocyclaceae bacterium]|nr:MAG: hypothetical protein FD157_2621 [Rhodocyclaceae bacterium]TND02052.1 MAG: hypothetical protein FD118_2082 [Rhodocyclaceae bacterium]